MSFQLVIEDLEVRAKGGSGPSILKGTSLKLSEGKIHGLVGPSGSGKSTLCQSILRLVESFRYSGSIQFEKKNLLELSEKELRQIRGRKISMIFQNPASAFNPYMKIGPQLSEALLAHDLLNKKDARKKVLELMEKVGVLNGESRYEDYSSQFSGGELQRLMIASAVSCGPKLVLADEPTTALDASLQIQILELLKELTQQLGHTLLVVSHDFSMISSFCEEIHFMELGKIVESGEIKKILESPETGLAQAMVHQLKTAGALLGSTSDCSLNSKINESKSKAEMVLSVKNLSLTMNKKRESFFAKAKQKKILKNIDMDVFSGDSLGIIGPSGAGKSSLARVIMKLHHPSSGSIKLFGQNLLETKGKALRILRKDFQIVFQNSGTSLNPKKNILKILEQPYFVHFSHDSKEQRLRKIHDLLDLLNLDPVILGRFPHQISGGQQQRVCIARALATEPKLIVFDEALRSLDTSVQIEILSHLVKIKKQRELTYIFISHDLKMVEKISNRLIVMNEGKIVEFGATKSLISNAQSSALRDQLNIFNSES